MTNLFDIIGKELSMEVADDVTLKIRVLSESEVCYQFVGLDENDEYCEDTPVITTLETAYDDIDDVYDYSFTDGIATRFFLFQFS